MAHLGHDHRLLLISENGIILSQHAMIAEEENGIVNALRRS
jgi:hypothetical protein